MRKLYKTPSQEAEEVVLDEISYYGERNWKLKPNWEVEYCEKISVDGEKWYKWALYAGNYEKHFVFTTSSLPSESEEEAYMKVCPEVYDELFMRGFLLWLYRTRKQQSAKYLVLAISTWYRRNPEKLVKKLAKVEKLLERAEETRWLVFTQLARQLYYLEEKYSFVPEKCDQFNCDPEVREFASLLEKIKQREEKWPRPLTRAVIYNDLRFVEMFGPYCLVEEFDEAFRAAWDPVDKEQARQKLWEVAPNGYEYQEEEEEEGDEE